MNKLSVLLLGGTLLFATALPAMAAGTTAAPNTPPTAAEDSAPLPNSVLYYGTVKEIIKDEKGVMTQLALDSEQHGKYVMNLSSDTVWIDSGKHSVSDPSTLKEGEKVYVFHSPASTLSLPPQSAAFVVVRNPVQDAGSAQYHLVESVSLKDGKLSIITDQGGLILSLDEKSVLSRYAGEEKLALKDIQEGDRVMAWYAAVAQSYPGQAYADHLMLLPKAAAEEAEAPETAETAETAETEAPAQKETALTRAQLVSLLYAHSGKPAAEESLSYTDVAMDAEYAPAVRWASGEKFISGYQDGTFRPENPLTREQLVTILWRYAGSPMLMDYTGLSQFKDAAKVSSFAQQAMMWAHQQKLISAVSDGMLAPQGTVTQEMAKTMVAALKQ